MDKYNEENSRHKDENYEESNRQKRVRTFEKKRNVLLLIFTAFALLIVAVGCTYNIPGELTGAEGNAESVVDYVQDISEVSAGIGGESRTAEEIPFVNITEADSSDLTITWAGMTEDDLLETENLMTMIRAAIDAFSAEGYSTGFLLYDLNNGGGISYHADEFYYSASAIKGPYVAWLVQAYLQAADLLYGTIQNTIQWSSNDDYKDLITSYGYSEFNNWAAGLGCFDIAITGEWYPAVNAREFAMLWSSIYDYFMSESCDPDIRELYNGTLSSAIYETLGAQYTVYSKGGWIGEGLGTYYNVQNDAGIVMKGEDPYVLVILSDAYGRLDLLDNLVAVLDSAHTYLTEN